MGWLLAAVAAAGAYMLARWLMNRNQQNAQNNQTGVSQNKPMTPEERQRQEEEHQQLQAEHQRQAEAEARQREAVRAKKNQLIDEMAGRIVFAATPVVLEQIKVGRILAPSQFPADDIDVRMIQDMGEMRRVLPGSMLLPDDVFLAKAAAKQLPVMQDMAWSDVIEDVVGMPINTLRILQDVSSSMDNHERATFSVRLNEKLLERAKAGKAIVSLTTFNESIRQEVEVNDGEGYEALRCKLPHLLRPNGNTDINLALRHALKRFEAVESDDRKLVLITDGNQGVSVDEVRIRLKELNVQLHVICIGENNESLRQVAHYYDLLPDS